MSQTTRLTVSGLLVFAAITAFATRATAQINSTWATTNSGEWHDAARWLPQVVPDNGTPIDTSYAVTINAAGASYTVTLDRNATVDQVRLDTPDAILRQTAGTLTTNLLEINAGTFELSAQGDFTILQANDIVVRGGNLDVNTDPNLAIIRGATVTSDASLMLGTVRLDDVTLGSDVTTLDQAVIPLEGTLQLAHDATLTIRNAELFNQTNGESVLGNGTVVLAGGQLGVQSGTLGPGVTVNVPEDSHNNHLRFDLIQGNIRVAPNADLRLTSFDFTNQGLIETDV
jgi:hypothetical protein